MYIRLPVIPGYNDSEDNIRATCEFVHTLRNVQEVCPLPMHHLGKARYEGIGHPYPIEGVPLIPDEEMQRVKQIVESYELKCRVGG